MKEKNAQSFEFFYLSSQNTIHYVINIFLQKLNY